MNNETTQLADYLGQMIRQATVETIRHTVGEDAATKAANSLRSIPLPGGDTEPADLEPATPVWPTAPYMWHDGEVWTRQEDGYYCSVTDVWTNAHMAMVDSPVFRNGSRRFVREAEPVRLITEKAWRAWEAAKAQRLDELEEADAMLMDAVDSLAQEVAR